MKKIALLLILAIAVTTPVFAKPNWKETGSNPGKTESAAERVGNEIADGVADVLTGDTSSSKTTVTHSKSGSSLPPGLAKQGKVPPGHAKMGHTEVTTVKTKEDSPIKTFIKNLFGKDS